MVPKLALSRLKAHLFAEDKRIEGAYKLRAECEDKNRYMVAKLSFSSFRVERIYMAMHRGGVPFSFALVESKPFIMTSEGAESDMEDEEFIGPDHPSFFEKASIDEVLDSLECDRMGLSFDQVEHRLQFHGRNELEEHTVHPVIQFLLFYWNPLSWTMELA